MLKKSTFTFALVFLLTGCSGPPSEGDARDAFSETLSSADIVVTSFEKTDGLEYEQGGVDTYDLEFKAKIALPASDDTNGDTEDADRTDVITGKIIFIRTEQGWRMEDFQGQSRNQVKQARKRQAQAQRRAVIAQAKQGILALETALKLYRLDNHAYPSEEQGLEALITRPDTNPQPTNWKQGGYLDRDALLDPWGNQFIYRNPGQRSEIDILTYGADGEPGGSGQDADISNASEKASQAKPETRTSQAQARRAYYKKLGPIFRTSHSYPQRARRKRLEGVTKLFFVIDRDGQVVESRVAKTSGHEILDQAALAILEKNPLPPLPANIDDDEIAVTVPVTFRLR